MHSNEVIDLKNFQTADTGKTVADEGQTQFLPSGTSLLHGQYKIKGYLNCGGFGVTYVALDSRKRTVVIKECFPSELCFRSGSAMRARSPKYAKDLKSLVGSFVSEAYTLADMRHDNIVRVHQIFEENDTAYMSMDFIDGPDLLDILEFAGDSLTPQHVQEMTLKLLDAIQYIHNRGLLHRDISPDNILVDQTGEAILIDFGAARPRSKAGTDNITRLKCVKDGYSPQEFYVEGSAQGPYSDLYSLAASIHHVICGHAPADGQSRLSALAANRPDPYVPLVGRVSGYPKSFLQAIDKALSVMPADRLQTADEWMNFISSRSVSKPSALSKPLSAVMESLSAFDENNGRSKGWASGRLAMAASAAGIGLLVGTGAFFALEQSRKLNGSTDWSVIVSDIRSAITAPVSSPSGVSKAVVVQPIAAPARPLIANPVNDIKLADLDPLEGAVDVRAVSPKTLTQPENGFGPEQLFSRLIWPDAGFSPSVVGEPGTLPDIAPIRRPDQSVGLASLNASFSLPEQPAPLPNAPFALSTITDPVSVEAPKSLPSFLLTTVTDVSRRAALSAPENPGFELGFEVDVTAPVLVSQGPDIWQQFSLSELD